MPSRSPRFTSQMTTSKGNRPCVPSRLCNWIAVSVWWPRRASSRPSLPRMCFYRRQQPTREPLVCLIGAEFLCEVSRRRQVCGTDRPTSQGVIEGRSPPSMTRTARWAFASSARGSFRPLSPLHTTVARRLPQPVNEGIHVGMMPRVNNVQHRSLVSRRRANNFRRVVAADRKPGRANDPPREAEDCDRPRVSQRFRVRVDKANSARR